tara:strand:- start:1102 stop:1917 length:816 start_codon:yes stop_codon:yes gene_type:complete
MLDCKLCNSKTTKIFFKTFSICNNCGCIFNNDFSDRKKLTKDVNYESVYTASKITKIIKLKFWDNIAEEYVNYLKSKTNMKFHSVLDVGALYGNFVKRFNDIGISTIGIESNKEYISAEISGKLSHGYFDETFHSDQKFDLICLTQMIYYVKNPILLIKKSCELLTDSGTIFISTQNPQSPIILDLKLPQIFESDMNILLSKKNFVDIAQKFDLKLIDFTNYQPNIYLDRLKNQTKKSELNNFIKYRFKPPYEKNPNGHHTFLLLSKSVNN